MITIIDYGIGNLASVQNMLTKIGVPNQRTGNLDLIEQATKIILPGVGAFGAAMTRLRERGMVDVLTRKVILQKTPVLGICLGMQLMTKFSEEGNVEGLGWVDAHAIRFSSDDKNFRVPHKGWSFVNIRKTGLLAEEGQDQKFYFDHSYHVRLDDPADEWLSARYGIEFTAAYRKDNITGVQFHPEKSHKYGMNLLRKFAAS